MRARDLVDLLLLAAAWGASFLFMRVTVPEFGPFALIELRVVIAALFLAPLLAWRTGFAGLRGNWGAMFVLGTTNSALPFSLFAYATLYLAGGFTSVLNAVAPMWGAVIAWLWLREPLTRGRVAGLVIGLVGVVILTWDKLHNVSDGGTGWALPACLLATILYGFSANFTRHRLKAVDSLAVATGSQITAAIVLLPAAVLSWPSQPVSWHAWLNVVVMGVLCTGIAYILFFRLIANVGPAKAIAVTFLVPVFGVVWGAILLDEPVTGWMLTGGLVILLGTALAIGLLKWPSTTPPSVVDGARSKG